MCRSQLLGCDLEAFTHVVDILEMPSKAFAGGKQPKGALQAESSSKRITKHTQDELIIGRLSARSVRQLSN